jgi:hypothetical protein
MIETLATPPPGQESSHQLNQIAPVGQKFKLPGGGYAGSCTHCHNGTP